MDHRGNPPPCRAGRRGSGGTRPGLPRERHQRRPLIHQLIFLRAVAQHADHAHVRHSRQPAPRYGLHVVNHATLRQRNRTVEAPRVPMSRTHLPLQRHSARHGALHPLTRTAHTIPELEEHRRTATPARDRIGLRPGSLADVLSGPTARIRAVQAGGPGTRLPDSSTSAPGTACAPPPPFAPPPPSYGRHVATPPLPRRTARSTAPTPHGRAADRSGSTVEDQRQHAPLHEPTSSRLQPCRLHTQRRAARGTGVTGTLPKTLRTRRTRLLQRRHNPHPSTGQ